MNKQQKYFERILFYLGLFGILVTVHLYIMNERGFDRGCMGFTTSEAVEEAFDCESVLDSEGGNLFGISNVYLGMAYYIFFVVLQIFIYRLRKHVKSLRLIRLILITFGLFYSIHLVYYQKTVLDEYCALCLLSAVTVFSMSIVQIIYFSKYKISNIFGKPSSQFVFYPILIVISIASVDFLYFQSLAINKIIEETPSTLESNNQVDPSTKPTTLKSIEDNSINNCSYNSKKPVISNYQSLINEFDVRIGNPGAANVILEFFDPNCSHCRKLSRVLDEAMDAFGDDVYFVFKPIPLWKYSIIQIQALYIAAEYELFFEMLEHQFAMQKPKKGLSLNQLKQIARNIGMDEDSMAQRIQNDEYRRYIMDEHKKSRDAGIKSAPTLLINGKTVSSKSRTFECISEFLD
jgi:uncharacterized membrane protein/protein-disulfide isomerase